MEALAYALLSTMCGWRAVALFPVKRADDPAIPPKVNALMWAVMWASFASLSWGAL